jgi:hypothetical protein
MKMSDEKTPRCERQIRRTCRSPGRNVLHIAYPQSIVRIHAVVFIFQIFKEPFEAEAKSRSSELKLNVRTSVLCPGKSTVKMRVASGVPSFNLVGWGMLWTSRAFDARAVRSCHSSGRLEMAKKIMSNQLPECHPCVPHRRPQTRMT